MRPNYIGGPILISGFWASIWAIVLYLLGVGLFHYLVIDLMTLFGLLGQVPIMRDVVAFASIVLPIVGTVTYVSWRWGWRPQRIGLLTDPAAVGWGGIGLALGLVAAVLSGVLGGAPLRLTGLSGPFGAELLLTVLSAFGVELVFRGVVISRLKEDLAHRSALLAAIFVPLGWRVLQSIFGLAVPDIGVSASWMAVMSVALSILYLRTQSLWLTVGLRVGMIVGLFLMGSGDAGGGGLIIWGLVAAIFVLLERRSMGRPPGGMGGRSTRVFRNNTVRGPWGPH